jgi:hypothetical protein
MLQKEYTNLHALFSFYEKTLEQQNKKLSQQEQIIMRLQTHISVSMRSRLDHVIVQRLVQDRIDRPLGRNEQRNWIEDPDGEWTQTGLGKKQFDLYGMNIRLLENEIERAHMTLIVKRKDDRITYI